MEGAVMERAVASGSSRLGEIVAQDYRAARVLESHGIDFCCGGEQSLAMACRAKALDPELVLAEIARERAQPLDTSRDFSSLSQADLIDHIVARHHAWLRMNDPEILAYTAKIASVHGTRHPELIEIAGLFSRIAADMRTHLGEEEKLFFPAVKRAEVARSAGRAVDAADLRILESSLASLGRDHESIGDASHEVRALAKGFALPDDACATYSLTYARLGEFERELHEHVHLENNILFARLKAGLAG